MNVIVCPRSLTCILCPTVREQNELDVGISLDVCRPPLHPRRTLLPTSDEGCGQPGPKSNCGRGSVEWPLPVDQQFLWIALIRHFQEQQLKV